MHVYENDNPSPLKLPSNGAPPSRSDPGGTWDERPDLIGSVVGGYRILRELGRGGMGVVYLAEHILLQRPAALKFLSASKPSDSRARKRFIDEARAAAAPRHPNICEIYDVGETEGGELFIAMAHCAGASLADLLRREGTLETRTALRIAVQIAEGLAAAHAKGIVHRDVKPSNVVVADDGTVKILDFGIAWKMWQTNTVEDRLVGTVDYMSPEQVRGEALDHRTDVWSLGVVLYEMFGGRRPFGDTYAQAVLYNIVNTEPPPLEVVAPGVPAAVCAIVKRCLSKEPDARYADCGELRRALEAALVGPAPGLTRTMRWAGRHKRALSVLATLLVSAVLLLLFRSPPEPETKVVHVTPYLSQCLGFAEPEPPECIGLGQRTATLLHDLSLKAPGRLRAPRWELVRQIRSAAAARSAFNTDLVLAIEVLRSGPRTTVRLRPEDAGRGALTAEPVDVTLADDPAATSRSLLQGLTDVLRIDLETHERDRVLAGWSYSEQAIEAYQRGWGAFTRGDLPEKRDEALIHFQEAVRQDSTFAKAYSGLAWAHLAKYDADGDTVWFREAERYAAVAQELDASSPEAALIRAALLHRSGGNERAIGAYSAILATDSTETAALYGRHRARRELGQLDAAERDLDAALWLRPNEVAFLASKGFLKYKRTQYEQAILWYHKALAIEPNNVVILEQLCNLYALVQRYETARRMCERGLEQDPLNGYLLNGLAYAHFASGAYADEVRVYQEALERDSLNVEVWSDYAEACGREPSCREEAPGLHRKALALVEAALAINPNDTEMRYKRAKARAGLGDHAGAVRDLEHVLSSPDLDAERMKKAARVYASLDSLDRAVHWIRRALDAGAAPLLLKREFELYPSLLALRAYDAYQRLFPESR